MGSDAPPDRVFTLSATVTRRGATAMTPAWVSGAGVPGAIMLPASFAVTPGTGGTDQPVELQIDARLASGDHGEPAVAFRRAARFRFVPGQTTVLRIYLSLACGSQATACTSVSAAECTVAVRCTEQGQTCGDRGECIPVDVMPTPTMLVDGSVNMSFDVTNDLGTDGTDALDTSVASDGSDALDTVDEADAAGCGACAPDETCCAGRCTNLTSDPASCGACGNACNGTICVGGTCSNTCLPGHLDCDTNVVNGCEVDAASDPMHCGACTTRCGTGLPCMAGVCACAAGRADCDGDRANGCESDLGTDANHCGACGVACPPGELCAAGACACPANFADCDGVASNGCETNTQSSANHCGACGVDCGTGFACAAGACVMSGCLAPTGECDGNPMTTCETNLDTSIANCGACGLTCNYPHGVAGCHSGVCSLDSCATGYADCDGAVANGCEVDLQSDPTHCGTCTRVCGAHATCGTGACRCDLGFADCDGSSANGCESDLLNSTQNCGVCGTSCSASGATSTCMNGSCAFGSCMPGFGNCDGMAGNGCEATLDTVTNCGACGRGCSGANASASCPGGTCTLACNTGFRDCDGMQATGCEVNVTTDPTNCGACGTVCPTGMACNAGVCSPPAGTELRASALSATHCHTAEVPTGSYTGGIAAGSSQVFVGGSPALRLARGNLSGVTNAASSAYLLVTDLRTSNVYALGNGTMPLRSSGSGTVTSLLPLNASTGTLGTPIMLTSSLSLTLTNPPAVFSGLGRAVILTNNRAYDVSLPSGAVVNLGTMSPPPMNTGGFFSLSVYAQGIAEFSSSAGLSILYVRDTTSIARATVPGRVITTVATFTNLGAITEITADIARGRWLFGTLGSTQFRTGAGVAYVGYCDAVWSPVGGACISGTATCGAGCVSTTMSDANCGACGTSCPTANYCNASTCGPLCTGGTSHCTNHCANLSTDHNDCGTCGHVCTVNEACMAGSCVCTETICSGACVNLQNDERNCGACGRSCAGIGSTNGFCRSGTCGCSSSQDTLCGTSCYDLDRDPAHCGTCTRVCAGNSICSSGVCTPCPTGETRCGSACFDLLTRVAHCGSCSVQCGSGQSCVNGVCM